MKLLKWITLIVLIQVGSSLWVIPNQVRGLKDNSHIHDDIISDTISHMNKPCETIILMNQQEQCSDWDFNKVKQIIEGVKR